MAVAPFSAATTELSDSGALPGKAASSASGVSTVLAPYVPTRQDIVEGYRRYSVTLSLKSLNVLTFEVWPLPASLSSLASLAHSAPISWQPSAR